MTGEVSTVLAVGDVVGEEAAEWLASRVPDLRAELGLDWVVVNGENCAVTGPLPFDGFGLTVPVVERLLSAGVDVITGGNHSWDGPDVDAVLALPRVVRPANLDDSRGRGVVTVERDGRTLTVVNLLSPTAPPPHGSPPRPLWASWLELRGRLPAGPVLVDLHGESPWEKASLATALDGEVAALVGTHTHDPTLRGHLLPGGTAFVTELGMTGRLGFTGGGFDPAHFAALIRGEDPSVIGPYRLSEGPLALGAVVIRIGATGRAESVRRVL